MTLVRWNPWSDLFSLHNQMDQLFNQTFGDSAEKTQEYFHLPVDIRQTDEAYFIEASVPGYKPENVEVTFDDGVLTIRGHLDEEQENKEHDWVRRERRMASVYRQVVLPSEVRSEEIAASFDNGVLTITVPRSQKAQPKRIPVTAGSNAKVIDAPKKG